MAGLPIPVLQGFVLGTAQEVWHGKDLALVDLSHYPEVPLEQEAMHFNTVVYIGLEAEFSLASVCQDEVWWKCKLTG